MRSYPRLFLIPACALIALLFGSRPATAQKRVDETQAINGRLGVTSLAFARLSIHDKSPIAWNISQYQQLLAELPKQHHSLVADREKLIPLLKALAQAEQLTSPYASFAPFLRGRIHQIKTLKDDLENNKIEPDEASSRLIHILTTLPREVFGFNLQVRHSGEETFYSPGAIYSNGENGYEIGLRGLLGSAQGVGISLQWDPFNYSVSELERELRKPSPLESSNATARLWTDKFLQPRLALSAVYRDMEGAGRLYGLGVSGAYLRPLQGGKKSPGIQLIANMEQTWLDVAGPGDLSGVRFELALAVQDEVPYLYIDTQTDPQKPLKTAKLRRWHVRYGFQYLFHNALMERDSYAFFVQLRDRGCGEYSLMLGEGADKKGFIGLGIATHFSR